MSPQDFDRFEEALPELMRASGWKGRSVEPAEEPMPEEVQGWLAAMDEPLEAPVVTRVRHLPLWSSAAAALVVCALGLGVYTTVQSPSAPGIYKAGELTTNLSIYSDNLGAALEAMSDLSTPEQSANAVTEVELVVLLRQSDIKITRPAQIVKSGGVALDRASLKAIEQLQEVGLVPWQGPDNLLVRYRLIFDSKQQHVIAYGQPVAR